MKLIPSDVAARRMRQAAALAFGLGVALATAAWHHASRPAVAVVDPVMERACGWPTREGEFMWVRIEAGKVKCGRYW